MRLDPTLCPAVVGIDADRDSRSLPQRRARIDAIRRDQRCQCNGEIRSRKAQSSAAPVTDDDPGYEYVKPADDADLPTTIVLYQLRDGKRDETLAVGYGDSAVREK